MSTAAAAGLSIEQAAPKDETAASGSFDGMVFCFTGGLSQMTRDAARAKAEALGARTSSSVTKKVTHVVAGEKSGSKLEKAEKLGLVVLTEDEYVEMLDKA